MYISQITARGANNEIGKGNHLPWHLPIDTKWFFDTVKGHPIIMGRKSMEGLGKPLPENINIVISRHPENVWAGFHWVPSVKEALALAAPHAVDNEVFFIGGGEIYAAALPESNRLYLTEVHGTFEGADAFYPAVDLTEWQRVFFEPHPIDAEHHYAFDFTIWERIKIM